MTVSNTDYRAGPYHSGADEGQNLFNFYFKVFFKEDVRVVLKSALGVESDLILDADYSVTMNGDQDNNPGGYVTTVVSYPFDAVRTITVVSNIPELQGTALPNGTGWNPRVVENGLDKSMLIPHQIHGFMDRTIRFPISEETLPVVELPSKENRANTTIGFDANGDLIVTSGFLPGEVIVSAFGEALVGSADAATALDQLGVSAFVQTLLPSATNNTFLDSLGAGTAGKDVLFSEDYATVQSALGISAFMGTTLASADPAALFSAMGFSAFGETVVQLPNEVALAAVLGFGTFGYDLAQTELLTDAQTLLDITPAGAALIDDATAGDQLTTLGMSAFFQTLITSPDADTLAATLGVSAFFPRGHIGGLTTANGSDAVNDIDVSPGEASDTTQAAVMELGSTITKQLDAAWAVGNNAGGRDTGAIANGTWHVFLIRRSDTAVVDVLFSLSPSAPTMPASYDQKRRIGSFIRSGGSILAFTQVGDEFLLGTAVLDVNANNPGTSAVLRTLTVPTGLKVVAFGTAALFSTATDSLGLITSPDQTDAAPSETVSPLATLRADSSSDTADFQRFAFRTNTSSQLRTRLSFSAGTVDLRMTTEGWLDTRGRLD
jgi:hypothetical protein